MLNKKERFMIAIVAELQRQFDENRLNWFSEANVPYNPRETLDVGVDGTIDMALLAETLCEVK